MIRTTSDISTCPSQLASPAFVTLTSLFGLPLAVVVTVVGPAVVVVLAVVVVPLFVVVVVTVFGFVVVVVLSSSLAAGFVPSGSVPPTRTPSSYTQI